MNNTEHQRHLTVVFMGDSITEGQYVHHSMRWTELVSAKITRSFAHLIDPERMFYFAHGVSGETTRQGLERFPRDVQQFQPDAMTLQFGLNDCNCWDTDRGLPRVSESAYRANLVEMIDRAQCFNVKKIVLSTNHPTLRFRKLCSGQTLEQRRAVYNEIVREVALKAGVTLCDIDDVFSKYDLNEREKLLLPEPDLLHLSPAGHRIYAEAICPILESAIQEFI